MNLGRQAQDSESLFRDRLTVIWLLESTSDNSMIGKQINKIPFTSSTPSVITASSIRAYMIFAVLLTGSRITASGSGILGGNEVSAVINSTAIQSVSSFLFWCVKILWFSIILVYICRFVLLSFLPPVLRQRFAPPGTLVAVRVPSFPYRKSLRYIAGVHIPYRPVIRLE